MVGYPGSGKTTTAQHIHRLTGAEHLWADKERSAMFKPPTHSHQENLELYAILNDKARQLLHEGKSVIFDTNFNFYRDRQKLRDIATKEGAKTVVVWITTEHDLARERATEHDLDGDHSRVLGNMSVERFEHIASNLEPPRPEENAIRLHGVDLTERNVADALGL